MLLTVNDREYSFPESISVLELIRRLKISPQRIAVERNGEVVAKSDYDSLFLEESDRLEIVQFVGGG